MIITELYPKQQRGYNQILDELDIPFLIYYSTSLWLPAIRLRQLRITWADQSEPDWLGLCTHDNTHKHIHIELAGRGVRDQLIYTLFHELVHAQQWHSGKLRYRNGHWYWNGDATKKQPTRLSLAQYRALPWESEADHLAETICTALHKDQLI
ncbi:MAG: hypothetical protein EBU46_00435 [Nitrosomonadaceae bacterium]|nr:hypothetical protein [Nitrosomonadaceae bacterium]